MPSLRSTWAKPICRKALILLFGPMATLGVAARAQVPPPDGPVPPMVARGRLGYGFETFAGPTPRYPLLTGKKFSGPIHAELKLTKAQSARIEEIDQDLHRKQGLVMDDFRKVLPKLDHPPTIEDYEATRPLRDQMMETTRGLQAEAERAVETVLEPRQRTRLSQIQLQADGYAAFARPDLQERLNMDPDQVALVQAIVSQGRSQMWDLAAIPLSPRPEAGLSRAEAYQKAASSKEFQGELEKRRAAVVKVRAAILEQIFKLLTKNQRATYRKLLGEPFDFMKLQNNGATGPAIETEKK
jgi:Spy/CpxP family protein refolding chaperone